MNVILTIVIKTICSFFGTVAFGKIFNCPKHCLYKAGFVGAVGFGVYIILLSGFGVSSMLSNFAGTVALSICSELFARWYKEPVPVFSIPGVIAKGKKLYDKRQDIARKDMRREAERDFKIRNLG